MVPAALTLGVFALGLVGSSLMGLAMRGPVGLPFGPLLVSLGLFHVMGALAVSTATATRGRLMRDEDPALSLDLWTVPD